MNWLCVIFHVQHRSDSEGHNKQQNMQGLGKNKKISILIDSHFYMKQYWLLNLIRCGFQLMNEQ